MRARGLLPAGGPGEIPASHLDLVECPPVAALTTVMPDGTPQTSVVWCDFDGERVRVNTMAGFQKERNMRRNPRVTLLCYDPAEPGRYLEVRGTVAEMTASLLAVDLGDTTRFVQIRGDVAIVREGALGRFDELTRGYTSHPRYDGYVYPAEHQGRETLVVCRLRARRVTVDAIHN